MYFLVSLVKIVWFLFTFDDLNPQILMLKYRISHFTFQLCLHTDISIYKTDMNRFL
jgi:hypothetical protein